MLYLTISAISHLNFCDFGNFWFFPSDGSPRSNISVGSESVVAARSLHSHLQNKAPISVIGVSSRGLYNEHRICIYDRFYSFLLQLKSPLFPLKVEKSNHRTPVHSILSLWFPFNRVSVLQIWVSNRVVIFHVLHPKDSSWHTPTWNLPTYPGVEKGSFESKVSCSRTQHNEPGQGLNLDNSPYHIWFMNY